MGVILGLMALMLILWTSNSENAGGLALAIRPRIFSPQLAGFYNGWRLGYNKGNVRQGKGNPGWYHRNLSGGLK